MKIKILCLLFLFSFTTPVFCLDMSEIRSQIRILENDNNSNSYRYSNQELLDRINIVQDDICAKTYCLQKRYYIDTSAGTQEYQLPSDCIQALRVGYYIQSSTSAYRRLMYTTIGGQDTANAYWQNLADGEPKEYYRRADYIGLKPAPSASYYGADYIQLDYVVRASTLTNTTDIPFNGDYGLYVFHQAIIYGVVAMCEYDKGRTDKYTTMTMIYTDWLNKIREIVNNAPEKAYLNFAK